jgi:hypothetical protein
VDVTLEPDCKPAHDLISVHPRSELGNQLVNRQAVLILFANLGKSDSLSLAAINVLSDIVAIES